MADMNTPHPLLPVSGVPWPGVNYGCTTRTGGVSTGPWSSLNLALHVGDDPQAVLENRRRLALGLPAEPFWLEQVHGTDIIEVTDTGYLPVQWGKTGVLARPDSVSAMPPSSPPRADAAITFHRNVVLAVMTADCIPVVMADHDGRALGVAHAGWRGLAAGVLESTLAALKAGLPDARGWRVWVGPCIGQARFEVGDDVRLAFVETAPDTAAYFAAGKQEGKWQADLAGLACHRLAMTGVYDIESSGLCTYECNNVFHSYRRSATSGRMATVAWLRGSD